MPNVTRPVRDRPWHRGELTNGRLGTDSRADRRRYLLPIRCDLPTRLATRSRNALVNFTPVTSSGVAKTTLNTDAQGVATLTSWTVGPIDPAHKVSLSRSGATSVSPFARPHNRVPWLSLQYSVNPTTSSTVQMTRGGCRARVLDARDNVVTAATNPVTLANHRGQRDTGRRIRRDDHRRRRRRCRDVSGLSISTAGTGYIDRDCPAVTGGLTPAASTPFIVTSGAPAKLVIVAGDGQTAAGRDRGASGARRCGGVTRGESVPGVA